MTLEKLSDFFGSSDQRGYLRRIYLSQKLEAAIKKEFDGDFRVIITPARITLECQSNVLALALRQNQRKLYSLLKKTAPEMYDRGVKLTFRVARKN